MRHLYLSEVEQHISPICLLVPLIQEEEIRRAYIEPYGLSPDEILVMELHYGPGKKTSMTEMRQYITEQLMPLFAELQVEYLLVADSDYFKALTKAGKTEAHLGYVLDCAFGPQKVVYVPNHRSIFYDPVKVTAKISQGIQALIQHKTGAYRAPGQGIIRHAAYPQSYPEIKAWLERLLAMDCPLTIDIEAFDLKPHKAGIGTISFAWSQHEGIAFPVDYQPIEGAVEAPWGRQVHNAPVRALLRDFFERYAQKAIYHNIAYDAGVLIYQLYMTDILDTQGLLQGLEVMLRDWDCTKQITFLATNSCAGNKLGLKDQSQEYAGNYAVDEIKDITLIPLDRLLSYNLVDALATWYVHGKHWPTVIADQQRDIYETLFKPSTIDIIQMQLTGLPVDMARVREVKALLEAEKADALQRLQGSYLAQKFLYTLKERWLQSENRRLKVKRRVMADADQAVTFNPNSDLQVQALLYQELGLPVIAYTDSRQPSTSAEVLEDLKNHTDDPQILDLLQVLLDLSSVSTVLNTFIKALENAAEGPDGWHYLLGNFNLGGTISGRLSSSGPNLQNIPAGADPKLKKGQYGKLIKSCFVAPPGWIFAGIDFNALEDRISALTTRDPNKLKVYLDGYDGHSLRAYAYYPEQMPDIDPNSVESINSIATKYEPLRKKSKNPTFTLTYQGTWSTLVTKYKFTPELAMLVEGRYHALYKVSDDWVAAQLNEACKTGYVTVAFGLRVRTPLLRQVIRGTRKTPHEAEAEGRSAGNALGQSWCLLNSRAANEFMGKVRQSEHRLNIRPCAQIHDAQYYLLYDDIDVVAYTNLHLVKAVQWQDHPAIWHESVKLGGELSLFWPSWNKEITLPNGATAPEIRAIVLKKTGTSHE